ncbi:hypothetical protein HY772_07305 [Candidatus Woesearchaeota archaeon]|nr:hypothetical protein [Candidatus Woesearchaeota archaeon]
MNKKIIPIVALTVLLIVLAGCNGGQKQQGVAGSQFVGGTQGLELSFVAGTPPDKVFDTGQPFGISVRLVNKGDYSIENTADATVTISGIDPADFGVTAADLKHDSPDPLRGAQKDASGNAVSGADVTIDFPAAGSTMQHQKTIAGSVSYNVRADVCYEYKSITNTKLCILEDILGTEGKTNTLCQINEVKTIDNSGAPVQIESQSFRESVSSSNKVAFVFKVKSVGTGTVHEKLSECDGSFQKKDKVHIKVDTGLSDGLTCSGLQNGAASGTTFEGDATLLNGEREIRCTQTVNNPTDLEKLVTIELGYDYKQFVNKPLVVQHVGG